VISAGPLLERPRVVLRSQAALFLPAQPSRDSAFAIWGDDPPAPGAPIRTIDLIVSAGRSVRRRTVTATLLAMPDAIEQLSAIGLDDDLDDTLVAWASVVRVGLSLVARGLVMPAMTADGIDTWRAAPLGPDEHGVLSELADLLPPRAYGVAAPTRRGRPLQLHDPRALVEQCVHAVADTMVRTAAAPATTASRAFAANEATPVGDWPGWLEAANRGFATTGARPIIRLDLAEPAPDDDVDDDGADGDGTVVPPLRATLQLRSSVDPSLIVDAADLWDAPAAVLARLGDDTEADLLLALRRGARLWAPLDRALQQARPSAIDLHDDEVADLFGPMAARLTAAGFEVLWPADALRTDVLEVKAVAGTPAPAAVTAAGLDMTMLLDFRWRVSLEGSELSPAELAQLAEAKRPLVRLRGRWIVADAGLLERLRRPTRSLRANDALAAALSGTIEVDGEPVEIEVEGPLTGLADRLRRADPERELPEPDGLEAVLRPYQRRGLAWMVEMASLGVGGCLADDMGLGKTIQLIALHLHRHRDRPADADAPADGATDAVPRAAVERQPTLVVCPTSLLGNWERELHRFAPGVPVRRYHGGQRHLDDLAPDEVVLVTYGVVRRDFETLAETPWGLVVADEAQQVKNPLSRTSRALRAIPGAARLALTGTPVENRLTELWAILDWTTPGLLGPLEEFRRHVAIPIERHRDPEATERLARIVAPFLLRRRKSDPLIAPELPPKTETDDIVMLTTEQVSLYEAVAAETLAQIADAEGINRRGLVLKLITSLKQVTNHPAHYLKEPGPLPGRSGKLAILDDLLDVIVAEGESALVFTQYVEMGHLLERHLADRGVRSLFLHGRTSVTKRQDMVDRFQDGEVPVFVLSLKAAGVGLNLTRASHVVHYDRWWNPAVEDQATDRAYRIGQTRPVQVHRLISEGTIEDRVASLLADKRALAESVVGAGEAWLTELSDDDLADLVSFDGPRA
jgi:superfamily II DNA or RNA helicase